MASFEFEFSDSSYGFRPYRGLKLAINREKSGIRRPVHFIILGFGFVPSFVKGEKGRYQLVVSKQSWSKLKEKLKTITRKTTPMSFDERVQKLN